MRLDGFLERLSADGQAPGSGSAAALTVAFAARLSAMTAHCSRDSWDDAAGVVAQATAISDRAVALAQTDARVWDAALAALRDAASSENRGDARRDFALEQRLEEAAAAPLEIASLGADAAALAALTADRGDASFRADAAAAAALAAGATRAAAHLVYVNLGMRTGDPRRAQARASEQAALTVVEGLLEPLR